MTKFQEIVNILFVILPITIIMVVIKNWPSIKLALSALYEAIIPIIRVPK